MGIVSLENTDRLYWLGRYSERVYTTIRLFSLSFDRLLDLEGDDMAHIAQFCKDLEIPNIYRTKEDFLSRYCFDGQDPNSINSNLLRAYDNCITLRKELGSETVAYIQLALYELQKASRSPAPLVELQKVNDNILAFWGIADDSIESENIRNIIKVGKRVERLDLYARLRRPAGEVSREAHRLAGRIPRTELHYAPAQLQALVATAEAPEPDYALLLRQVEALLEGQI